jgi:hypothetical protein
MKRSFIFFFFLLLFSHCEKGEHQLPDIRSTSGQQAAISSGQGYAVNSSTTANQPSLSRKATRSGTKRKKRKALINFPQNTVPGLTVRSSDSTVLLRMNYLRSNGINPDLNEPVSKNYLFSPIDNRKTPSIITLGRESFIQLNFDNDILDYTDRFYTNGIKIEIISPGLQMNPVCRLLLPYWGSATNYYGLSLVQNMFTPSTTKTGGILHGDRPYAAYLYAGSFKITNDPTHRFRQTSELDAGIIGPNSYGEWVQRSFHNAVPTNNEPLGWEYQIKNDLVLNYSVTFEKGIIGVKNFDFLLSSTGNAGTLYTNVSGGFQVRSGWLNPYFANLGISKRQFLSDAGLRKFQFFFFVKGSGKVVGYDATLQGGLFNQSSSYTLPAGEISRVVFQGSGGVSLSLNGIRLDLEQFVLSPEFHDGWWHKWVHVAVSFSL